MTDLAAPSRRRSDDTDRRREGEEERASERSEVRRAVARFLLTGLVTLAVVAAPATLVLQHLVQTHTLEGLEETTSRMAENMVAPLVDDRLLAGDPEAVALLDRVVRGRIAGGSVIRITVWTRSGLVLFSDARWLVGQRFPDHEWVDILPADGGAVARFEDADSPVDEHSEDLGHAVEVDAPFVADSGDRLVLEAHFPAAVVHAQERDLLLSLLPVGIVTLVALQLAQLPPAIRLARRIQGLNTTRRRLLRQAAAASDLERRRIVRDLHDEVIQDLAGASYALESLEGRLDPAVRPEIARLRAIVRSSVGTLRSMLTEVYPTEPDSHGLPAAVDRLADRLRTRGVDVRIAVPDDLDLSRTTATLLYRVAREALGNATAHAQPTVVTVTARRADGGFVLEVADDGVGFDPAAPPRDGHLGLQIVRDTVREAGGQVTVRSTPGAGTTVTATVPLT